MSRYAKDKRDLPHPRPVQKIELSGEHTLRQFIAAGLFLLIGGAALAYAVLQMMTPDTGWQAIQASASGGPTCGEEFVFLYELGAGGLSVSAENKAVRLIYTEACRKAYQLFHTTEGFEGVVNLYELSRRPNEVLEVDKALYDAFDAVRGAGDRTVYLGPVCARYGDLFYCRDDAQLVDFDPRLSEAVAEEYAAVAAYAADPGHIDVELLGENKLCLRVSQEYLAYAGREGIECFLDFGWMKNAFITDYLAEALAEGGFSHGAISSFDGFSRCLDRRSGSYSMNLYGRQQSEPVHVGVMEYQGPMSLVSLRAFPVDVSDDRRFYQTRDGQFRTQYLDLADGVCRNAVDSMVCYASGSSCAQLAMEAGPLFIADSFREDLAEELAKRDIQLVWCRDQDVRTTDPELNVKDLHQGYTLTKP